MYKDVQNQRLRFVQKIVFPLSRLEKPLGNIANCVKIFYNRKCIL
ncbi:hypothetical protein RUMCAL_02198 [Ruminococcus callidus ATCC 27760]|uniref:Uncharacterized protein n=1 Tax=Ruminococcus callidus ATCC 27760 TaxID=411473 RepID=U2M358_9FIRM|nr:hypothetical protein RUMCAL_02198 [Ruminococcus callidus ATCC 27760]